MKKKRLIFNRRLQVLLLVVMLVFCSSVHVYAAQKNNKITASSMSVYQGRTRKLNAKALGGTLQYKSSDTRIATVNSKGVIKGIRTGRVTITISTRGNKYYKPASKRITVKVVRKKIPSDKLQYKYEVKFFGQPYKGKDVAYFIKTNNPDPTSFNVVFYDQTGYEAQYYTYVGEEYLDLYNYEKLGKYYKVPGGYVQVVSFSDKIERRAGIFNVAIEEYKGWKRAYMGKIRLKDYKKAYEEWKKSIIQKVTTPNMTKPEKMQAIANYLLMNSQYLDNYTNSYGQMIVFETVVDVGQPHFETYKWDSLISPYMLADFGEMIGYPLDSLYDNYPIGSSEWYMYHWFAKSVEDGSLYECCPMGPTGEVNIDRPEEYPQLNCLTYRDYYVFH